MTRDLTRHPNNANVTRIPMRIGGEWRIGETEFDDLDPYRREVVARVPESTAQDLDDALNAALTAKATIAAMPAYKRAALLHRESDLLTDRIDTIAEIMSRETGKAIKDARAEVARSQDTLTLSAEEAIRIEGEHVPLDGTPTGIGKLAMLLRFPVGVVAAITPFNAPFNLACHKVAPAIAAGNAVVLKPPSAAPYIVHKVVELFVEAGTPPGVLNAVYGRAAGPALVRDPRVDFITFTGSERTGAEIKAASGLRRVALELGNNGPVIVHADASVDEAASLCARNAMRIAGQSCVSVQNIYTHQSLYERFLASLVREVRTLRVGDPLDPATDVGTLIDEAAAERVEQWVEEAVTQGARVLTGGRRRGAQYEPTVLIDTQPTMRVCRDEIFGPVVTVRAYADLDPVFAEISESRYGLQCGVFTQSLEVALRAVRSLRTGGVIINGTSTWRVDQMAYGGIKDSGIGREGPHYAIEEMTDQRLVVFNM